MTSPSGMFSLREISSTVISGESKSSVSLR